LEEKVRRMDSLRKTAIIVGALFIIATVTAVLSIVSLGSTLDDDPGYLTDVSANENQVIVSVVFWLILAVSVAGIGVVMYPVLKKYVESLALAYVGFRLIEAILIVVASISLLSLLTLSQEYVGGSLDASYYQPSGASLLALQDWSFVIGTMIFLGLGGLPLYYLLYQSRLVPRWLSVWGIIGAALILLYGLLMLFDLSYDLLATLAAPIAVQEMVFAALLIVRGFDTAAIESGSGKTDMN
jgi:hypothetical protein